MLGIGLKILRSRIAALFSGKSVERLCVEHVQANAKAGDPDSVLSEIDKFCRSGKWLMNVGDEKGLILDNAVRRAQPQVAVEMGCYCGYSAVRIARLLPPGGRLISLEISPDYAVNARAIIQHAGLADKVTVEVGPATESLPKLREKFGIQYIDLLFVDHDKKRYLPDLLLVEKLGYLRPGSVVVGDNIVLPGAPDFLRHVQTSPMYKTELIESHIEYSDARDAVTVSVVQAVPERS